MLSSRDRHWPAREDSSEVQRALSIGLNFGYGVSATSAMVERAKE